MDRTAIAAIIIGFGGTVAAMVMPQKYPQAPKWAVDLSWWGGAFLIVAGAVVLLTDFTFADLGDAAHAWSDWTWSYFIWLLGQPASWVLGAFVAGVAVHRWRDALWNALPSARRAGPNVLKWHTPQEAAERFIKAEIVAADRSAQEESKQLGEVVRSLEAKLVGKSESKRASSLRQQLANEIKKRDDAVYAAARRRTDLIDALRITLKAGMLVGKGRKLAVKWRELVLEKEETLIPMVYWRYPIDKTDVLNLDSQNALSRFGRYTEVLIGKDENWKGPPRESSA